MPDTENTRSGAKPKRKGAPAFTKAQLLGAKRYANRRDALSALLKDGQTYTHAQVERMLENYMKGGVK